MKNIFKINLINKNKLKTDDLYKNTVFFKLLSIKDNNKI